MGDKYRRSGDAQTGGEVPIRDTRIINGSRKNVLTFESKRTDRIVCESPEQEK
jgi:hypothetical protein